MAQTGQFRNNKKIIFGTVIIFFLFIACNNNSQNQTSTTSTEKAVTQAPQVIAPQFNSDSAYTFIKTQVDFGPRIPGTKAHENCADFLIEKLKSYGLKVIVQQATVTTYDSKSFILKNITASYKPESNNRILLTAHWDTRPWADLDSINPTKPFDGADDGASGVGVLLEVARQLNLQKTGTGVDIVFFDIEDYGEENSETPDTWCLGSQYWSKNLPTPNYSAKYGILLDMVGAANATFPMEGTSMRFAPNVVQKVWETAAKLGYSNYFIDAKTGETTDDHYYVNAITGIPTIDIVHYDPARRNYPYFHHCHSDNMSVINKKTLNVVGQLLLELIYQDK
ncbi:MAG: M28 family peptidase [Bacteroidia bacterium]